MSGSPEHVIDVVGLSKHYGSHRAVDDMSFRVRAGSVTGFLGPNGAGKSTTMRMMVGLTRPSAGHSTVLGVPYTRIPTQGGTSASCSTPRLSTLAAPAARSSISGRW
jgi:ABC-type Na+ transport system ATPase subunit NatA